MTYVILINAPIVLYGSTPDRQKNYISDGDEYSFYPINLLYIAAYLIQQGYTVKVLDPTAQGLNLCDIEYICIKENPKIIGITAMTASIQSAVILGATLKQRVGVPIILGGIHQTNDPTFIKRFPVFDYGVVGDGERVFYEIMQGNYDKGVIHAPRIEDLDSLPFPARHLVDIKKYMRPEQMSFEAFHIDILTSRGCAFNCSFCSIVNSGHKVRFRSAKNVVDEMEATYDICKGNYTFNDDCFTFNKRHVLSLAQEITERGIKARFMASTRATGFDEEMAKALKRMGCINLCIGVESGSERIRNEVIGKKVSDKDIYNCVALCRKHGITASLFIMAGLPTETREDMKKTVEISPKLRADYIGVHQTTPYPGSRIWTQAIKEGKIPADLIDQWASGKRGRSFKKAWLFYIPDGFTQKDMIDYKRRCYLRFYFDPKWIIRKLWRWIRHPMAFIKNDLKLFKLLPSVIRQGGTKGQFS